MPIIRHPIDTATLERHKHAAVCGSPIACLFASILGELYSGKGKYSIDVTYRDVAMPYQPDWNSQIPNTGLGSIFLTAGPNFVNAQKLFDFANGTPPPGVIVIDTEAATLEYETEVPIPLTEQANDDDDDYDWQDDD